MPSVGSAETFLFQNIARVDGVEVVSNQAANHLQTVRVDMAQAEGR
jgi:hypothetical protein